MIYLYMHDTAISGDRMKYPELDVYSVEVDCLSILSIIELLTCY